MLQDNIVSTSDESIPIVPRNQVTIVVNMNNFYPRRGPLCPHGRIYAATFDSQTGIVTTFLTYDEHVPNLKVYTYDAIIICHYCYLSEKKILDDLFATPAFQTWKANFLAQHT